MKTIFCRNFASNTGFGGEKIFLSECDGRVGPAGENAQSDARVRDGRVIAGRGDYSDALGAFQRLIQWFLGVNLSTKLATRSQKAIYIGDCECKTSECNSLADGQYATFVWIIKLMMVTLEWICTHLMQWLMWKCNAHTTNQSSNQANTINAIWKATESTLEIPLYFAFWILQLVHWRFFLPLVHGGGGGRTRPTRSHSL